MYQLSCKLNLNCHIFILFQKKYFGKEYWNYFNVKNKNYIKTDMGENNLVLCTQSHFLNLLSYIEHRYIIDHLVLKKTFIMNSNIKLEKKVYDIYITYIFYVIKF